MNDCLETPDAFNLNSTALTNRAVPELLNGYNFGQLFRFGQCTPEDHGSKCILVLIYYSTVYYLRDARGIKFYKKN